MCAPEVCVIIIYVWSSPTHCVLSFLIYGTVIACKAQICLYTIWGPDEASCGVISSTTGVISICNISSPELWIVRVLSQLAGEWVLSNHRSTCSFSFRPWSEWNFEGNNVCGQDVHIKIMSYLDLLVTSISVIPRAGVETPKDRLIYSSKDSVFLLSSPSKNHSINNGLASWGHSFYVWL